MSPLRVKKPPAINRGRKRGYENSEWHSLLRPAMKRPGTWYVVEPSYDTPSMAASAAYEIRSGRNGAIPEGEWDAVSRYCDLYVMYLGDK